ncbi:hypothetical protein ACFQ9X_31190 [Catenulispora yoronensis]
MTATAEPTTDRTAALTGALTEQGWTYTREPYAEPQFRIQVHPSTAPTDGCTSTPHGTATTAS